MSFFKNLFKKNNEEFTKEDFWNWFMSNEKKFHTIIKNQGDIESDFFDKLSPQLEKLRENVFYVCGMKDENTAELILTVDGRLKNIPFIEELVSSSPPMNNWLFTPLKPPLDIENVAINTGNYLFDSNNIFIFSKINPEYPDEIHLTASHIELNDDNSDEISFGIYLYLENYLGELNFTTIIDEIDFKKITQTKQDDLIPIEKLKSYIKWRQKEFIEKYEGTYINTENDHYTIFEAQAEDGTPFIMNINTSVLQWDKKASHPWLFYIDLHYDGKNNNGLPSPEQSEEMNELEDKLMEFLPNKDGNIYIGRTTGDNNRRIYFTCKEFRTSIKNIENFISNHSNDFTIEYDFYKDKYWKKFNKFMSQ